MHSIEYITSMGGPIGKASQYLLPALGYLLLIELLLKELLHRHLHQDKSGGSSFGRVQCNATFGDNMVDAR